jgi:hypothetical protein
VYVGFARFPSNKPIEQCELTILFLICYHSKKKSWLSAVPLLLSWVIWTGSIALLSRMYVAWSMVYGARPFAPAHVGCRDGNGYPWPMYPAGKYPIGVRVWDKIIPMDTQMRKFSTHRVERVRVWDGRTHTHLPMYLSKCMTMWCYLWWCVSCLLFMCCYLWEYGAFCNMLMFIRMYWCLYCVFVI